MTALVPRLSRSPLAPLGVAACAAAACTTLALVDPNEPGRYPVCPFLALTGRWCPGCGSLRGMRALLTGQPLLALNLNALLVLVLPYLLYSYVSWASPMLGGPALPRLQPSARTIWGIFAAVMTFWFLRNIPLAPFTSLAP